MRFLLCLLLSAGIAGSITGCGHDHHHHSPPPAPAKPALPPKPVKPVKPVQVHHAKPAPHHKRTVIVQRPVPQPKKKVVIVKKAKPVPPSPAHSHKKILKPENNKTVKP